MSLISPVVDLPCRRRRIRHTCRAAKLTRAGLALELLSRALAVSSRMASSSWISSRPAQSSRHWTVGVAGMRSRLATSSSVRKVASSTAGSAPSSPAHSSSSSGAGGSSCSGGSRSDGPSPLAEGKALALCVSTVGRLPALPAVAAHRLATLHGAVSIKLDASSSSRMLSQLCTGLPIARHRSRFPIMTVIIKKPRMAAVSTTIG